MKNALLILFTLIITCCNDDNVINIDESQNRVSIDLIKIDDTLFFKKTVVLFEDERYLVKTNFETFINAYPFDRLSGYNELSKQAKIDTITLDTLMMEDYLRTAGSYDYVLAHHLENGTCLIYDKQERLIIGVIEMEEYFGGEPMQMTGGRIFYINNEIFFETVDKIS